MSDTTPPRATRGSLQRRGAATIEVENPATGEVIAAVQVVAPDAVAELVARARRAQPGWEALGFDGRAAVLKRCQKWIVDNSDRVIDTIVSETGKTYEDALLGRGRLRRRPRSRSGRRTPRVPRRREGQDRVAVREGPPADRAPRPGRRRRA